MHSSAKRFLEEVEEEHGFTPEIQEFPEGTKTAEDAAEAIGCEDSKIL